jgi:hypothetical protein
MKDLEKRVEAIEQRNAKVEQDKAWETSWVRRLTISVLTYGVIVAYLMVIDNEKPFINALVPAVGFFLSTLVLRQIRSLWENKK